MATTAPATTNRPCERWCPGCQQWLHHSRFRVSKQGHRSMSQHFKPLCKACEQKERNEQKNADRPLAIITGRAKSRARELGVSKSWMLVNMNWIALVPLLRALLSPEGRCLNCGHRFVNERDIQIDHVEPPRHQGAVRDWARERASNLRFICQSCNCAKGHKSNPEFLDEQEDARLSNERHRSTPNLLSVPATFDGQLLFRF